MAGGGGGGAGAVGGAGATNHGGDGGNGTASVYAYGPTNPVTYAGGGGGGNNQSGGNGGDPLEVTGGGGPGGYGPFSSLYWTRSRHSWRTRYWWRNYGGPGAEHGGGVESQGGYGGSGVVVVRYEIGKIAAVQKATGGSVSFYNNKTIHTFTSSDTFSNIRYWTSN